MPSAKDFMATDLVALTPEMTVHDAMRLFLDNDISGAPVVDPHGDVVGMLTERDCLQVIYAASYHKDPGGTVAEHMSSPVETLDADADLITVIERFLNSRFRRFPVLAGTRLVGLISRRDILRSVLAMW
jgi:CBS domain-containing protein